MLDTETPLAGSLAFLWRLLLTNLNGRIELLDRILNQIALYFPFSLLKCVEILKDIFSEITRTQTRHLESSQVGL